MLYASGTAAKHQAINILGDVKLLKHKRNAREPLTNDIPQLPPFRQRQGLE